MNISTLFLTVYFWALSVGALLLSYVICMISYPFIDQKTFARMYETITAKTMLYFMTVPGFWKVKVTDLRKDKSWKDKRYVIIGNHLSFIDSLVTVLIPLQKKFMVGHFFTKIAVFGWLTKKSGFVTADRNNPNLNKDAVERAVETMKDGCSFCIFPQGRREPLDKIENFKTGAFRIAHKVNIPILPITLKGTEKAMPIGGWVYCSDIEIIIHEPFYINDDDYKKWAEHSKSMISSRI